MNDHANNVTSIKQASSAQAHQDKERYSPPRPKGHEVILASLIKKQIDIQLKMANGSMIKGRVTQFDDTSITIRHSETGQTETFYKHAIDSFTGVKA